MAFLAHAEIEARGKFLFPDEYAEGCIKEASYDLRLGAEIYIVGQASPKSLTELDPYAVLKPGEFAILTTHEKVKVPSDL